MLLLLGRPSNAVSCYCQNSLYLYLSACGKNTGCYVLEKKTCSATVSWMPHLPELLEGFSLRNVLKPMCFFSWGSVLLSFKSMSIFPQTQGHRDFTSSLLITDITTCFERLQLFLFKKKQVFLKTMICRESRCILLIACGLQRSIHSSGYFWVSGFSVLVMEVYRHMLQCFHIVFPSVSL